MFVCKHVACFAYEILRIHDGVTGSINGILSVSYAIGKVCSRESAGSGHGIASLRNVDAKRRTQSGIQRVKIQKCKIHNANRVTSPKYKIQSPKSKFCPDATL